MPPLLADFIHAGACIPICEKFLTRPYPEEIDGLRRDYEKLWGEVSKVLRELSELVAK